jgi:uncharacterized protein Smg (DUF494 family)
MDDKIKLPRWLLDAYETYNTHINDEEDLSDMCWDLGLGEGNYDVAVSWLNNLLAYQNPLTKKYVEIVED